MNIIFYHPTFDSDDWLKPLQQYLPQAHIRAWKPGDKHHADYALVWHPPLEMLAGRTDLKAVFALGAGVDSILSRLKTYPQLLPEGVPLYRMKDTGMARQMQEYVVSQVLRWFRRFDDYQDLQQKKQWLPLEEYQPDQFTIGILGAGVLGSKVAESLLEWGFPVRSWSRSRKSQPGVTNFAGANEFPSFLSGTRVLINLLPKTTETENILNKTVFDALADEAYLLNLARGEHIVEQDLLHALESGKVKAAMLDVFCSEPLPQESTLWQHPRVAITPHIAAVTRVPEAINYIATTITAIEKGEATDGLVDLQRGY